MVAADTSGTNDVFVGTAASLNSVLLSLECLSKNESHCESVPIPEKLDKHNHDLTGSTTINSSRDSCVTYLALST